mmetsp:Transcript_3218/g.7209  ORF Transcript_3218/g.7209 Transcript_3218/m.7209 type:complete len:127 (+) Transcript_3218:293-673(+)
MVSTGGSSTTTARGIVPKIVRLVSSAHAAKQHDRTIAGVLGSSVFSRRHFPKTLAATCLFSFGFGFCGMHRWQQKRQWEWEKKQEEIEHRRCDKYYYYNNNSSNHHRHAANKNGPAVSTAAPASST